MPLKNISPKMIPNHSLPSLRMASFTLGKIPDQSRSSFHPKNGFSQPSGIDVLNHLRGNLRHGNHTDDERRHGENRKLHHLGDHDAYHAAFDRVQRRERTE